MLSKSLIRLGIINDIRGIGSTGIIAVYKKYDYRQGYRKRSKIDEYGEMSARLFTTTLEGLKELEKGRIPGKGGNAVGVYCGIKRYLKDVESEVLEKLSKVAEVIEKDAEPESVKEAIKILDWYRSLAEERTDEDYQTYGAIISGGRRL